MTMINNTADETIATLILRVTVLEAENGYLRRLHDGLVGAILDIDSRVGHLASFVPEFAALEAQRDADELAANLAAHDWSRVECPRCGQAMPDAEPGGFGAAIVCGACAVESAGD